MSKVLFLYLIEQDVNTDYDTYDSAVVVASSAEEAKKIDLGHKDMFSTWAAPKDVKATRVGKMTSLQNYVGGEIICASFNAG